MQQLSLQEILDQDIESLKHCPFNWKCASCPEKICVNVVAIADFPSEFGTFQIIGFTNNKDGKDHAIILKGDIGDGENMLTRVHSACLTGDALGSRRCDCRNQLIYALKRIEQEGRGIVLYHQAEGRGIGLVNKLRAYALQDNGIDTLDANLMLGFEADERDYEIPIAMLKKIGVNSVRLMTNNPDKISNFEKYDLKVAERVPHEIPAHEVNSAYLTTKKERFGHYLDFVHDSK